MFAIDKGMLLSLTRICPHVDRKQATKEEPKRLHVDGPSNRESRNLEQGAVGE